jgi:hypothetical protein
MSRLWHPFQTLILLERMPLEKTTKLSPKERLMQETIKKVLNDGMSYEKAAVRYGVCERTVRRKVDVYLKMGAGALPSFEVTLS